MSDALKKIPKHKRHHLFLIRCKAAWPQAWDSIIDSSDDADDMVVEKEYENVVTMANGTKVVTVKTAKEVAADAADIPLAATETSVASCTAGKKRKARRAR
jgi:hypothetical protein